MKHLKTTTASLKRCVFSCFLKDITESTDLRLRGGELHRAGASVTKALSPLVFNRVLIT